MGTKPNTSNNKKNTTDTLKSFHKAITPNSTFEDKDELLDIVYWGRQIVGAILGVIFGIIPLKGMVGIGLFCILSCGITYLYCIKFQGVDEEEYGGLWEIIKEGFMTGFASFLVLWIIFYTGMHFDDINDG